MSRFNDDLDLVPEDQYCPMTTRELLRELRLRDASPADQRQGVSRWLRTHEPSDILAFSLRHDGFGELLAA